MYLRLQTLSMVFDGHIFSTSRWNFARGRKCVQIWRYETTEIVLLYSMKFENCQHLRYPTMFAFNFNTIPIGHVYNFTMSSLAFSHVVVIIIRIIVSLLLKSLSYVYHVS